MNITSEMIERARKANACREALSWLERRVRTLDDLCAEFPEWYFWAVGKSVIESDPARLDACAEREPGAALEYASALLAPARLAWCKESS